MEHRPQSERVLWQLAFRSNRARNQQRVGRGGKQQRRKYADSALERFQLERGAESECAVWVLFLPIQLPGKHQRCFGRRHLGRGTSTYTYYTGEDYANTTYYTLFEHWDGNAWSIIPGAATNGASAEGTLYGVAAVSSDMYGPSG